MNQAIQFPDREEWDAIRQAVCFPVMVNGWQLTCGITGNALRQRFGEGEPLALFRANRWDLEDQAQELTEAHQEDDQGWIWLS